MQKAFATALSAFFVTFFFQRPFLARIANRLQNGSSMRLTAPWRMTHQRTG